ncbi:hypothetical protein [Geomicrobium sp. JCM 19038]|uniref:hypothetical protein n=1 Tax=Geomicrobium sp. JCM 19038 TaxID=1460635 RepID=UPI00045F2BDA|nr:hypothetical protein [Geomicrobium sp. JCM 19038]GAK09597.1 hypothetical protein JCM19038_3439 [Geomicrobium sp. JCM 19038]
MVLKQRVSSHYLKHILIDMNGQEICAKGKIKLNDILFGKGIVSVDLKLMASEKPVLLIEYMPSLITRDLSESLGLRS